ncbi:SRPBCC domain-containing protein [Nocardioides donggukensis]|uniref:SRPBCC domain-containing protein n=1 Tax=Nocardioides donggukensis TaxID=2774019 RepID=A0A927K6F4_9ACTN|nr:SRPBCC domain-containing protein [Nocardioides donggukensis]MBD8869873.1 SRPBCC domain-containing protein [Nocardioides donggukensis]
MNVVPTGRIVDVVGSPTLVLTRAFPAPREDVWAALTEPARLERWIGTWSGDPEEGQVRFRMTAEEGHQEEEMEIRECEPPHVLKLTSHVGDARWLLDLELVELDGVTTLTFLQPDIDPVGAESIGPGWEFYLDRLVAALGGGDVDAIDFDRDYYPAMQEYYRIEARTASEASGGASGGGSGDVAAAE